MSQEILMIRRNLFIGVASIGFEVTRNGLCTQGWDCTSEDIFREDEKTVAEDSLQRKQLN